MNKKLFAMNKRDEISEALYTGFRSTGAEPAKLYGLASLSKAHQFVLSFLYLNSSYDHLNETLAEHFDKIEGANIETNTQMAREISEKTELDSTESTISPDVKSS